MTSLVRTIRTHVRALALWALVAVVAAAGLALMAALDGPAPRDRVDLPWWLLAIAFAAVERFTIRVHFRRSSHALTLAEIPLVIALAFDTPGKVAGAWALGLLVALAPSRPIPVRLAYNLATMALGVAVVAVAMHRLPTAGLAALCGATVGGVLASSVVTVMTLALAMALAGELMALRRLRAMALMGVAVSATNASLGLAAVSVLNADPWAGLLLVGPIAAIYVAYRAYTQQRRQHLELEFLYDAGRTLAGAADSAAGLAGVLAMALETFRAEVAEVYLVPAGDDAEGRRITLGPDRRVDVLQPLAADVGDALQALVADDPETRVRHLEDFDGALAERLAGMDLRETMIAPLPGEHGLLGTMMMANRRGGSGFEAADRRLLATLAAHTASALGQDHLERRVDELRALKEQLYHQAFHDALTGLANRLLFNDRVAHALARRDGNVVVIYIDLDDFKPVNDTYGHEAGDLLLQAVGDRLRDSLRPADTPARLGGDEFAVLLTDVPPEHVPTIADRILRNFAERVDLGDATAGISASMGIAIAEAGAMGADELLRQADAAMYVAKRGGKRGYAINGQDPVATAA